ncbi:MAG: tRNA-dihydrouridine synthase [Granulosicoccus sp.]|nr:tRNA-dihydrouridine synthase [Granulosicoccus sp.]
MNKADEPRIVLAPMEGVIDAPMRAFLTSIGGYHRCVTEFIRVTDVLLPERVFLRLCPELATGGETQSGVPVYCQLLGSDPVAMAANARRAAALGTPGIDLNFGCPARTVNNSMGGSVLLQYPDRLGNIVRAVRDAVPAGLPVTAKIRLGYENHALLPEIVENIRQAGASELAIHARTKFDGYKPPAWWSSVKPVMYQGTSSTYINGEIWTVADSCLALQASGCEHLMLGRGALASPDLARRIQSARRGYDLAPMPWSVVASHVERQFLHTDCSSPRHIGNRTKQWLAYLKRAYSQADELFSMIRKLHDVPGITQAFAEHRRVVDNQCIRHCQV